MKRQRSSLRIAVLGSRGFPNVQGGVEKHCEELYPRIVKENVQVLVFSRAPYTGQGVKFHKRVKLLPLACPKQKFLEAPFHTFLGVLSAKKFNPDILHIHAIGPSLMVPLARLLGLKVVVTNHGPDYQRKKWKAGAKFILKLGEFLGSHFSHAVIAISRPIQDFLKKKYNRSAVLIPNGVTISGPASGKEFLEKYGLLEKQYILAVGRLVPEKGFHDLVRAFEMISLPRWKLVIAGAADHEDDYSRSLKNSIEQRKGIVLTGFITGTPLRELYSHAGIFVLPSYHEGLPIALLEAMSYGLPVLASDIEAHRSLNLAPESYFRLGQTQELAARICKIAMTPFEGREKEEQIEWVKENYDWDKVAASTLAVYRQLSLSSLA